MNSFSKAWAEFSDAFTGALILQSKKQPLSYALVKIVLEEKKMMWLDPLDSCGAWLRHIEKESPEKGQLIQDILVNDMKVEEVAGKNLPSTLPLGIALAGGAIGCGTARLLGAPAIWTAASALAPMAILYPASKVLIDKRNSRSATRMLDDYMAQLEKFRLGVESILAAEA